MSKPAGKSKAPTAAKPTEGDAPAHPIPTLSTPAALVVRHVHPILLLSLFYLRFDALVADPVSTLSSSLPIVAAIEIAYATVCLPPAGSQPAKVVKKPKPGEKKKATPDHAGPNVVVTTIVAFFLSIFAAPVLHIIFVLFGAPFLTHIPETLLCSLHVSLLGLFPLLYTHGVSTKEWLDILGAKAPFDEPFGSLLGACFGAWLGAVPIPLDWDREWQKWPVTILCGVYAGCVLGKLVGGTVAFGRRFA